MSQKETISFTSEIFEVTRTVLPHLRNSNTACTHLSYSEKLKGDGLFTIYRTVQNGKYCDILITDLSDFFSTVDQAFTTSHWQYLPSTLIQKQFHMPVVWLILTRYSAVQGHLPSLWTISTTFIDPGLDRKERLYFPFPKKRHENLCLIFGLLPNAMQRLCPLISERSLGPHKRTQEIDGSSFFRQ